MADTITTHTSGEVADLLKRWGFVHASAGKNHKTLRLPSTGKTVAIRKARSSFVGQYVLSEITNLLGVTEAEFFAGPPEKHPILQVVRDPDRGPKGGVSLEDGTPMPRHPSQQPPVEPVWSKDVQNTAPRRKVILYLHSKGGFVRDPAGKASVNMAKDLGMSGAALSMLLKHMERDGQTIKSTTNPATGKVSKATYEILLVEDGPNVAATIRESGALAEAPVPATRPVPDTPTPVPEPVEDTQEVQPSPEPRVEPVDYKKLAEQVINELVRRLTTLDRERALQEEIVLLRERLGRQTEYTTTLRKEKLDLEAELEQRPKPRRRRTT